MKIGQPQPIDALPVQGKRSVADKYADMADMLANLKDGQGVKVELDRERGENATSASRYINKTLAKLYPEHEIHSTGSNEEGWIVVTKRRKVKA